jgi:hypothetical protein
MIPAGLAPATRRSLRISSKLNDRLGKKPMGRDDFSLIGPVPLMWVNVPISGMLQWLR